MPYQKNAFYRALLTLSFFAFLAQACQSENKPVGVSAATQIDPIQQAIDKGEVIYVFDNAADMQKAEDAALALGGAIVKKVDAPSFYAKDLSIDDFASNYRAKTLEFKPDGNGMLFSRYDFDLGKSKSAFSDLRKAFVGEDVVVVTKQRWFGNDYAEIRPLAEVDAKLTDLSWGTQANKNANALIEDLRPSVDDPKNAMAGTRELKVDLGEKVDPDVVIARLQTEFGTKYAYKQVGARSIEIRPHDEMVVLQVIDGRADKTINGMTQAHMQKSLMNDDFLAPGAGIVVVLPNTTKLDWAEIRKSGLYDAMAEVNPSVYSVRSGAFGRQTVAAVYLRRAGAPAGIAQAPLDILRKPETVAAIAADPARYNKVVNEGALALRPGVDWVRQPGFESKRVAGGSTVLGKGGFGQVEKVLIGDRYDSTFYAQKTMAVQNFQVSQEVSNGIILGELGIGPRIERAEISGGKTIVTMELLETDAKKMSMNRDQILSYADKMLLTKKYGLLQLDDKPANILLDKVKGGVEAKMNDFAFMQQVKDGVVPGLQRYGTYAAPESTLRNASEFALPDYKTDNTRSFFFGFNVLYSRMGRLFEQTLVDTKAVDVNVKGVWRIDGDLAIEGLRGRHAEAGMSEAAFNRVLDMMRNDYKSRPSIESFVKDFGRNSKQFEFVTNKQLDL